MVSGDEEEEQKDADHVGGLVSRVWRGPCAPYIQCRQADRRVVRNHGHGYMISNSKPSTFFCNIINSCRKWVGRRFIVIWLTKRKTNIRRRWCTPRSITLYSTYIYICSICIANNNTLFASILSRPRITFCVRAAAATERVV